MKKKLLLILTMVAFLSLVGCSAAVDVAMLAVDFAGSTGGGAADIQVIAQKKDVVPDKSAMTLVVLKMPVLNTVDAQKQVNYIKTALANNQINYTLTDKPGSIYRINVDSIYRINVDIELLEAIKKADGQHDLRVVVVATLFKKNVVLSKIAGDYKGKSSIWSEFNNMEIAGSVFDQILAKMYAPPNSSKATAATVEKK
ncbi:MAG: hypothetical protein ABIJ60_02780 [Patescibacteria group bacterium]